MNESILDLAIITELLELSAELDQSFYLDIVSKFKRELPAQLQKIEKAIQEEDFKSLLFQAHALKGQASVMGARLVAKACDQLETAAHEQSNVGLKELLQNILFRVHEALPALDSFLESQIRAA